MIPSLRTVRIFGSAAVLMLLALFVRATIPLVGGLLGLFLLVLLVDALRTRGPAIVVSRVVARSLALGVWCDVTLRVEGATRPCQLTLYDHHPIHGVTENLPQTLALEPEAMTQVVYRFKPQRRGAWEFEAAELRLQSPWGLWQRRMRAAGRSSVKVFPDFRGVRRFALLAVENPHGALGIKRRQQRGEALELRQLREYRDGDSPRHIDWKATSRRRRLISREFEDERNQNIVFMLDCSRRMRATDGPIVHFDQALNSVLLLTYVALRQGDAVGLMTLGGTERWVPPQKGGAAMNAMLQSVYDLETGVEAADYTGAAMKLMTRQRRRALIVLVSNLRDEDGDEVSTAARFMRRRHLVLLASMREAALDRALEAPIEGFDTALRAGALSHYLEARRQNYERFGKIGILALDVTPSQLPISLVNHYLDIKRAGAL